MRSFSSIDCFLFLYNVAEFFPKQIPLLARFWRGGWRCLANVVLPVIFRATMKNKNYCLVEGKSSNVVVSLTSFPKRIGKVWLVVESLLRQTVKPAKIILWLSREQFSTIEELPVLLKNQRLRGLQIELRDGDLRSHKKWFYMATEMQDTGFITADDDVFYDSHLVEDLVEFASCCPQTVFGRWAKIVYKDESLGKFVWGEQLLQKYESKFLHFGGGGGCYYPPFIFPKEMLNPKMIMSICPLADDIWLNVMCRMSNVKMMSIKPRWRTFILPIIIINNETLTEKNCGENKNEEQAEAVRLLCVSQWGKDPYKMTKV